jgi:hypothetical protein
MKADCGGVPVVGRSVEASGVLQENTRQGKEDQVVSHLILIDIDQTTAYVK